MKLSVRGIDPNFSKNILFHLFKVTGLSDPEQQNECIGKTIGQVVNECSTPGDEQHNLNLIALRSAGKNLFETVELIRSLYIIGDGECPKCGSNDFCEDNFSKTCNVCFTRWDKNEK